MYRFVWLKPTDDLKDARIVRSAVFCDEQGYSLESEFDELDAVSEHLVVYDEQNRPVATGRIFDEENGDTCIGRICVLSTLRGQNMGRQLMEALMARCEERGAARLHLGAQCRARGFYEKLGFAAQGEIYPDGHVPHIAMYKTL